MVLEDFLLATQDLLPYSQPCLAQREVSGVSCLHTLLGQYDDLASRPRAEASALTFFDHLLLRLPMSQTTNDHRYALSPRDTHVYASTPYRSIHVR